MEDTGATGKLAIPPAHVQDAIRRRLPGPKFQQLEAVLLLRSTAQQVENAASEWLAGTVGSTARFQTLMLLWAGGGRPTPHQEIIAMLQVKRATVSALMFSLEQDGLVQSVPDRQDRRRLLASLTGKGEKVISDAMDLNATYLGQVMHDFSPEELDTLKSLLRRVREDFVQASRDGRRVDAAP